VGGVLVLVFLKEYLILIEPMSPPLGRACAFLWVVMNEKFKLLINKTDEFRSNEELFLKSKNKKL
jgi:hypothetical protein